MTDSEIEKIRKQFPILDQKIGRYPLTYLDNGATTQKPLCVIDAIRDYYLTINSNVHRGVHRLSQLSTEAMEMARQKVSDFIGAKDKSTVIFTRGTTEAINAVASGYSQILKEGEAVVISAMEHHSNIVPWQMACQKSGAILCVIPMSDEGVLDIEEYEKILKENRVRIVSVAYVSNVLGTVNPVAQMVDMAHKYGAEILIDGAQSTPHIPVNVEALDCDYYAFSGHKMYAPTGIGVLYGKRKALENLPPYQGGGDMIDHVTFEKTTYAPLPFKFEAGTPNIEGAIAMGVAIDFLSEIGMEAVHAHERELMEYMTARMKEIDGMVIYGSAPEKSGAFSFTLAGAHPTDIGTLLDNQGVAIRTGHHCAEPLMTRLGIPGTARASLAVYNTREDIDRLVEATIKAKMMLLG
ncbi:MAG: cysteine desulfurase [Flavobacteriales bacterium]|nr:cysteine desulfurase [Flavobacteriales bacterium]MBQ5815070.1 cysteine desulfurase [Flavobacteriales bacterium]